MLELGIEGNARDKGGLLFFFLKYVSAASSVLILSSSVTPIVNRHVVPSA